MSKFTWDEKLIAKYMLDPNISPSFDSVFAFLEHKSDTNSPRQGLMRVLSRDFSYIASNPFIYDTFDKIITPGRSFAQFKKRDHKISINEALRLTHLFYANTDEEIYNCFFSIFEKIPTNFMLVPLNIHNQASGFSGHCYTSSEAKDVFIDVLDTSNYDMLSVIIHEFAHSLAFVLRGYNNENDNNITFGEFESLFIELVANDWFIKNSILKEDAIKEMKKFHNEIIECAELFLEISDVCDMVRDMHKNNKKIDFRSIIAEARENFSNMSAFHLKKIFASPLEYDTPYGYSGLLAIELYHIYLQDPKAAFDLYKRIILGNKETAIETNGEIEQLGIIAGEHFDDFARLLKR